MHKLLCLSVIILCLLHQAQAQVLLKGKVFDAVTNQPLQGVTVSATNKNNFTNTDKNGNFSIHVVGNGDSLSMSIIGYESRKVPAGKPFINVLLNPSFANLTEVVVTGNRDAQRRTEVPVAIDVISKTTINETKATRLDMLINKVPGAFMVDLGNEQHSMSIRQPLGYNNLYLYLQDGVPIRTIGDFNHNALIEINQASLQRIEVVKGPASSLYGSEAVGGAINFITQSPSPFLTAKLQAEADSRGYKRTDFNISNTIKKFGFYAGGYIADQQQSNEEHNNFYKAAITLRGDYSFTDKTKLVTTADIIHYKTDQKGGLDSAHFYNKDYNSVYRFTYRKVDAVRVKSTLSTEWNSNNKTSFTLFYRHSAIGQNPFYSIGDVYTNPAKATGQINDDAFNSYGAIVQHSTSFNKGKWITGISADFSPATYYAKYIDIDKNTAGVYYNYTVKDSLLTDYKVNLFNSAIYSQLEYYVLPKLKLVAAARYDRMDYKFDNYLAPGAYSGAPDAKSFFDHFTPKLGLTYQFNPYNGLYANYSVGFAPPNITDLYTGVEVPVLKPSTYRNYEVGGWLSFDNHKGYAEVSLYKMNGNNEIVSVRLPNGTYQNQNAGETTHKGVELNIKYAPCKELMIRTGGTVASHLYKDYVQQGANYSNNQMPQAPAYIINSEVTYKPSYLQGFRVSVEHQGVGSYYTDAANTARYKGFNVFNARAGYRIHAVEVWANCINVTNKVYATTVEKSAYGTSYRPGQLRTINIGIAYNFSKKNNYN